MASTINAQTTPFAAIVQTADDTGNLALQTANVTALTIDTNQNATFANVVTATTLVGSANASSLSTGTVPTARLASGTANSSTYLRGDQTWASVPTTSPGGSNTYVQYNNAGAFGGDSGFVYSSGNVGIGVTPSASASGDCKQLALGGLNYLSSTSGTSGKANFYTGLYYNAYQTGQSTFNAIVSNSSSDYLPSAYVQFQGVHRWLTASSATAGSAISFTQAMELDNSGNLKFNSGYGSTVTAYGCRAWVNFQGTGTVSIRGSGNVSSVTDFGTGNYGVNYSTAMPDTNYSFVATGTNSLNGGSQPSIAAPANNGTPVDYSTGSTRIYANSSTDITIGTVAVFR